MLLMIMMMIGQHKYLRILPALIENRGTSLQTNSLGKSSTGCESQSLFTETNCMANGSFVSWRGCFII